MSSDTPDIYSDDEWDPCFYICSYVFDAEIYDSKTSSSNYDSIVICGADEFENLLVIKAWWTIFRMILSNQKHQTWKYIRCCAMHKKLHGVMAPLNEKDGLIYRTTPKKRKNRIISPKYRDSSREPRSYRQWVSYPVHARCWELLMHHELDAIAKEDLPIVLAALRQNYKDPRHQGEGGITLPKMSLADPSRIKLVSDAIDLALEQEERRKPKQEPSQPRPPRQEVRQVGICNLPANILYIFHPNNSCSGECLEYSFWRFLLAL